MCAEAGVRGGGGGDSGRRRGERGARGGGKEGENGQQKLLIQSLSFLFKASFLFLKIPFLLTLFSCILTSHTQRSASTIRQPTSLDTNSRLVKEKNDAARSHFND